MGDVSYEGKVSHLSEGYFARNSVISNFELKESYFNDASVMIHQ